MAGGKEHAEALKADVEQVIALVRGAENPQSVRDPPARRSRTIAETTASWPRYVRFMLT